MSSKLAIDGGTPVRTEPMPTRGLIGEEEKAAALHVFDRAIASGAAFGYNGPFEKQYEKDFADFMGGGFADGVNSGTNAVYCALGALQIDALSEVICPPITDAGGIMPVVIHACVPVLADSDPRSFNTTAEQIERLISERTRAIIVAHILGEPVDMDPVMELAEKRNLFVIEDCAQAHGAKYKGRLVGTIGHVAAFSTMSGKHHCTGAQGGVVYTKDEELYWNAKRFADRGKPFNLAGPGNVAASLNCNLNELSAAIGSEQLTKLPGIINRRREIGEAVKQGLADRKSVSVGWQVPDTECTYWWLRLQMDLDALTVNRDQFCEALGAEGIPVEGAYGALQSKQPWFKNRKAFGKTGFPWSCSDYKGPKDPQHKSDNAVKALNSNFRIRVHEQYGEREVQDILAAVEKVEQASLR